MPIQTQSNPVTIPLKFLAFSTLVVIGSKASPIPQSIGARGLGITSPSEGLITTKNILEWLFAAAAVVIVCSALIWRWRFLRARNRPLQDFFSFFEAPRQRGDSSIRQTQGSGLTPTPFDRQRRGRTHATDIDSEGRRMGGPDPDDDANGDITEKEALPAYEVKGGPPNYGQITAVDLGTSTDPRTQVTGTMPVGMALPQPQPVQIGSGTTNLSTQQNPGLDVQLPHPPPPSYSPVGATTCPVVSPTNP